MPPNGKRKGTGKLTAKSKRPKTTPNNKATNDQVQQSTIPSPTSGQTAGTEHTNDVSNTAGTTGDNATTGNAGTDTSAGAARGGATAGNSNTDPAISYRVDAVIARNLDRLPRHEQLILTSKNKTTLLANVPCPLGKPVPENTPNLDSAVAKAPVGILLDDHPPRGSASGLTPRAGNIAYLKVTINPKGMVKQYTDSTGQTCRKDYIWFHRSYDEDDLVVKLSREAIHNRNNIRDTWLESQRQYEAELLTWQQTVVADIRAAGTFDEFTSMAKHVKTQDERIKEMAEMIINSGISRNTFLEVMKAAFPTESPANVKNKTTKSALRARKGTIAKNVTELHQNLGELGIWGMFNG
jgi:hypothetical protein